jgi:uncharacterized protein YcbX
MQLVLIEPRISGSNLAIHIPRRTEPVLVPLNPTAEQLATYELVEGITIWEDTTDAYAVSEEADQALTEYFQKPARLVMKGPERRQSQPTPDMDPLDYEDTSLNFQGTCNCEKSEQSLDRDELIRQGNTDQYSFLLCSTASLAHVRSLLLAAVSGQKEGEIRSLDKNEWTLRRCEDLAMERFRPNIVVEAAGDGTRLQAFEEDLWKTLAMGNGGEIFFSAGRCPRCMVGHRELLGIGEATMTNDHGSRSST